MEDVTNQRTFLFLFLILKSNPFIYLSDQGWHWMPNADGIMPVGGPTRRPTPSMHVPWLAAVRPIP